MRVLIVDDEPLARSAMRRLLAPHRSIEIVGEADSTASARTAIMTMKPDLVFLDIELGGDDGFDLLASLDSPPIVIFVTAYAEHAVAAFAVDAIDYLLKPVDPERLAESLARAERQRATRPQAIPAIELRTPRRTVFAQPGEIVLLRADGDFTRVHLAGQPPVMIWRTLAHFESLLPAPPFLRLGRSLIVNRDRLRSVETLSRTSTRLTLEGLAEPIEIGRSAAARLRDAMEAAAARPISRAS
ncbi:MAG: response regulator transcription factor [Enhydrobacter sp.]|nr:response regulator transcription factor [Enhydrobacter sp.]